ncbi:hypothetical protein RF11_04464 [Thelohanellus kitauei]|uniref:Uncharacterized protein n=1 Tax=Thelohanellus kitauei TaxID=669202 RepID=A0A0C2JB86_THEKT|nr:hypothetical protein RF11_04464 [Thelohanellus kitauei]
MQRSLSILRFLSTFKTILFAYSKFKRQQKMTKTLNLICEIINKRTIIECYIRRPHDNICSKTLCGRMFPTPGLVCHFTTNQLMFIKKIYNHLNKYSIQC